MKERLVARCLEEGIMVTPDLLGSLTEENIDVFIRQQKEPTKTLDFLVTVKPSQEKQKLVVKDFIDYYQKKYHTIAAIVAKKLDPVSISHLKNIRDEISIIGSISEVTANGFLVEDLTGSVEAKCEKAKELAEGSVLGFKGRMDGGVFLVSGIVFPDVPLAREIGNIDIDLLLTTELKPNQKADLIILFDQKIKHLPKEGFVQISHSPTIFTITSKDSINMLVLKPDGITDKYRATYYLKTRCIPTKIPSGSTILSDIPDIFWIVQPESWSENYKGVTIISGSEAAINLDTREVSFA